ncbi:monocarboxylate transporter 13-like [Ptychodera flava]|uniref:monocarboxylate transporter 13-like n=1 Tax=Ptychodera flava TaxID=63121 RepID=UPI003969C34E
MDSDVKARAGGSDYDENAKIGLREDRHVDYSAQRDEHLKGLGVDGGFYAWLVVLCSHVCLMFVFGLYQVFGNLFVVLQHYFDVSSARTAWIIGTHICFLHILGPIAGVLTKKLGYRTTTMAGGVLSSMGYFISSFAHNIEILYLGIGVLVGTGYALILFPSFGIVPFYVKKKYALANAISTAGGGIGTFIFAPLFRVLVKHYGWRGALIFFSGLNAQTCVCAALYRAPAKVGLRKYTPKETISNRRHGNLTRASIIDALDFQLFVDHPKSILFLFVSVVGIGMGFMGLPSHLIARAEMTGIGDATSRSWFLSMLGASSIIGRFAPTPILLRESSLFTASRMFGGAILCGGLSTLIGVLAVTYTGYAVYACLFGFFTGSTFNLVTYVMKEIVGSERLVSAAAFSAFFTGIATLLSPVLAGLLYDATGNYNNSFYYYGAISTFAGLMMLTLDPWTSRLELERQAKRHAQSLKL